MHVQMYVCMGVWTCVHSSVHECMCVYVYVYVCARMSIYLCIGAHECIHVCIYILCIGIIAGIDRHLSAYRFPSPTIYIGIYRFLCLVHMPRLM